MSWEGQKHNRVGGGGSQWNEQEKIEIILWYIILQTISCVIPIALLSSSLEPHPNLTPTIDLN